jgi:hypothetical protein
MKYSEQDIEGLLQAMREAFEERLQEVRNLLQEEITVDFPLTTRLNKRWPQKSS